jgi:hypothetical protein
MTKKAKPSNGGLPEQNLEFENLEKYLNFMLGPVKPRQEFIQGLRGRLDFGGAQAPFQPKIQVSSGKQDAGPSLLLILVGLAGSLILLATGIKATVSLIEAMKAVRRQAQPSGMSVSQSQAASLIKSASIGN